MDQINLYDLLECQQTASKEDIKHQYKKLALKFHPDKIKSNSTSANFDMLTKAYEILLNDKTRREYDIDLLRRTSKESDMIVTETITVLELLNDDDRFLYYDCRCGGQFVTNQQEFSECLSNNNHDIHIQCNSCSLFLHIIGIEK